MNTLFSELILLAVLLGLSAFFAGAETVFFSLSRSQLAHFRESKNPLAKQLLSFLSKPRDILVTILFGNELTNIAISILVAAIFFQLFPYVGINMLTLLSVIVGTFLILVIGEIIPKSIGILFAPALAPLTAFLLKPLYTLLRPLRRVLVGFADWLIKKTSGTDHKETLLILDEELRSLLELSAKSGELEIEETEMIHKALDFKNKVVSQIMTPMDKVFSLSVETPYHELLNQIHVTQFSRIPIYEGKPSAIIGLLYVKDLFRFDRQWQFNKELTLKGILRAPIFISRAERLEDVLQKIKETRIHMAIVLDQQKNPIGIVTLHDILEELFGELGKE